MKALAEAHAFIRNVALKAKPAKDTSARWSVAADLLEMADSTDDAFVARGIAAGYADDPIGIAESFTRYDELAVLARRFWVRESPSYADEGIYSCLCAACSEGGLRRLRRLSYLDRIATAGVSCFPGEVKYRTIETAMINATRVFLRAATVAYNGRQRAHDRNLLNARRRMK